MMRTMDVRLRRHAIEIVAQLPTNAAEARVVLAYARELLDGFLSQADSGGSTPSLRAISSERSPCFPSPIHPMDKPGI